MLQSLAEEKAISERNAMERDNAERDARQNETKVCVLTLTRSLSYRLSFASVVTEHFPTHRYEQD